MPEVNIASGEGGEGKYVIFKGYCLYVPRVLARVVDEGEGSHSLVECELLSIGFSEEFCFGNVCAGVKGRLKSSVSFWASTHMLLSLLSIPFRTAIGFLLPVNQPHVF